MKITIAGGTGTAGRVLAARAHAAGHHVRVLTRRPIAADLGGAEPVRGDLRTGTGLDAAVEGADAVVDLSDAGTVRYGPAASYFTEATAHLLAAERRAGVAHHLTVSIAGVDRFPSPYYRAKLEQERVAADGAARAGVGFTLARVTQFHDFAAQLLVRLRLGPVVAVPALHVAPVHLGDVADHLLALLAAGPAERAPDLAGPREERLVDMVRRYARATGTPVRVLPVPLAGAARRADRAGVLRPTGGPRGLRTFTDWLGEVAW